MLILLLADILPVDRNFQFSPDPGPYIALFGLGFVISIIGHIAQSKTVIALGLVVIMLSTVLLPVVLYLGGGAM